MFDLRLSEVSCVVHKVSWLLGIINLPIVPISTAPPIIPFLFYCVDDIITMQDRLYIIFIVNDCFNRIFDFSIRASQSFAN